MDKRAKILINEIFFPIFTVALVLLINSWLTRYVPAYTLFYLFVIPLLIHTWISGFWVGLYTMFLTILSIYVFNLFSVQSDIIYFIQRTALYIVQGIIISAFLSYVRAVRLSLALANKELQAIRYNYQKLFDASNIGMMIGDKNGKIYEANDAFLNMLGYQNVGNTQQLPNWIEATSAEYMCRDQLSWQRMLDQGISGPLEKAYLTRTGEKVPALVTGVLLDEKDTKCICIVINISEQKKVQSTRDDFISMAGHELKTPLTALSGYLQLAKKGISKQRYQTVATYLEKVEDLQQLMNYLVDEIIDLSQIQAGALHLEKSQFDLVTLVNEVSDVLKVVFNQRKIMINFQTSPINVFADRAKISQVLLQLLTNSLRYSSEDVRVFVKQVKGKLAKVEVVDYGKGIPPSTIKQIFKKKYAKPSGSLKVDYGLGVGLYLSAEIVKRHGGSISVSSEINKKTVFTFTIPLH